MIRNSRFHRGQCAQRAVDIDNPGVRFFAHGVQCYQMKQPEYIEGTEAETRFLAGLKTVLSVPKSAAPNPFSKPKKRKSRPARKS
jgi:hypothetical protein